jgi:rhomboid protease GlpG
VILLICVMLFLWNNAQKKIIEEKQGSIALHIAHTSLERELLIDYPAVFRNMDAIAKEYSLKDISEIAQIPASAQKALKEAQETPTWTGLYPFFLSVKKQGFKEASRAPVFAQVREGQIWRLFTPCLLHYDFLHILFNMAWLLILGKQIEARIRLWKMGILILAIGIISNCAQYLVSGPSFFGFSGVIVGMAGFIWMRQRCAAWEGYPLSRTTLLFLILFVAAMAVLGFLAFALNSFSILEITPIIANTAHIVGGICGVILGRFSFFARGRVE